MMTGAAAVQSVADHRLPLALLLATLVCWTGFMAWVVRDAALADEASGLVMAVFPPDRSGHETYAGILRADGFVVQNTWFDNIWVVRSERAGFVGRLKEQGAWAAFAADSFQPLTLGGCFLAPGAVLPQLSALKTTTRSR